MENQNNVNKYMEMKTRNATPTAIRISEMLSHKCSRFWHFKLINWHRSLVHFSQAARANTMAIKYHFIRAYNRFYMLHRSFFPILFGISVLFFGWIFWFIFFTFKIRFPFHEHNYVLYLFIILCMPWIKYEYNAIFLPIRIHS